MVVVGTIVTICNWCNSIQSTCTSTITTLSPSSTTAYYYLLTPLEGMKKGWNESFFSSLCETACRIIYWVEFFLWHRRTKMTKKTVFWTESTVQMKQKTAELVFMMKKRKFNDASKVVVCGLDMNVDIWHIIWNEMKYKWKMKKWKI